VTHRVRRSRFGGQARRALGGADRPVPAAIVEPEIRYPLGPTGDRNPCTGRLGTVGETSQSEGQGSYEETERTQRIPHAVI